MTRRRFADDLRGPAWEAVRSVRRSVLGGDGLTLDEDSVPVRFRHLLPYASLLGTGEEGTLFEFWNAMGQAQRDALMSTIGPLYAELRDFGLGSPPATEREAMLDLARLYDLFEADWYEGRRES